MKPIADIWIDRALDALAKGDLDSAETRLIISDHLSPSAHAKKLLETVRRRQLFNNGSNIDFSQFRDRKVDSEECVLIAKIAIEIGDFKQAKKFLLQAEKVCPSYYSKKLLKKIKYLQNLRIRQEAKKKFAEKWIEDAVAQIAVGNYKKAEKLLQKSLKVFSTIKAQTLLKQVQDAIKNDRRNSNSDNRNIRTYIYKVGLILFNIFTCNCVRAYQHYTRLKEETNNTSNTRYYRQRNEENTNDSEYYDEFFDDNFTGNNTRFTRNNANANTGNANTGGSSSRFSFTSNDIPHSREYFGDNTRNSGTRNSQYRFTSEDIPGNNTNNFTNHTKDSSNHNTHNSKNNGPRNTQYRFTSESIPGNNTRNNANGSKNHRGFSHESGNNKRSNDGPGNNKGSSDGPSKTRSSSTGQGNNRGSSHESGDNRRSRDGTGQNQGSSAGSDYKQGSRDSGKSSRQHSWRRFFTRDNQSYTQEQSQAVLRVLLSEDKYDTLGLSKGCTRKDVQSAFRKLALILHPDKNKAPRANEAFMKISEAKDKLLKITSRS